MDHQTTITIEEIRQLRHQLMAALDDLREVEHRVQKAHHVYQRAVKIVETFRSWRDKYPSGPETSAKPKPSPPPPEKLKFLSGADLTLFKEQKATMIIERLVYDPIDERYEPSIFAVEKAKEDFAKALPAKYHVYDYVFTDSKGEREFVEELEPAPRRPSTPNYPADSRPTTVGDYNPDWAIAFDSGKVKHVYFIAETKGTISK